MFKAYIYILLLELLAIALIAGKPTERNIVQEIEDQGYHFEETMGIRMEEL